MVAPAFSQRVSDGGIAPSGAASGFAAGMATGPPLRARTLQDCLSPFTDLTLSGESIRSQAELDPIMHPRCLPDFVTRYAAESELRHPLASPLFGDYTGLPPLLIQVGQHEIIRDDSVRVAERARAAGVEVTLEVWEGMFHVFQSHEPLLPEGREAIEHIAAVIRSG